jgi:hypothetical protein
MDFDKKAHGLTLRVLESHDGSEINEALKAAFNAGVHAAAVAAYEVMRPGEFTVDAVTDAIHSLKRGK